MLPQSFYLGEDVVSIAKQLLGKSIYTQIDEKITCGIIVETEAYRAPDDKACHAYGNRKTDRTKTMFLEGGTLYVYISYGIHRMINVVTGPSEVAHAILVRAIEPIVGQSIMASRRGQHEFGYKTVNGPGKAAKALGVDTNLDGVRLFDKKTDIWIEEGIHIPFDDIVAGPRVGMSIHTGPDAHRPWRFYIKDNPWVSRPKVAKYPNIPVH